MEVSKSNLARVLAIEEGIRLNDEPSIIDGKSGGAADNGEWKLWATSY